MGLALEPRTVYVDPRAGSDKLLASLRIDGVAVEPRTLEFGDVAFAGLGQDKRPVSIGVEYKTVKDVLNCIGTGRFTGHQLPGMCRIYDYSWLVMEGEYKSGTHGSLLLPSRTGPWSVKAKVGVREFDYIAFKGWLTTLQLKTPCKVLETKDLNDTMLVIEALVRWWAGYTRASDGVWIERGYDKHASHLALHHGNGVGESSYLDVEPSLCRLWAAGLPGVGNLKSKAVDKHFKSAWEMAGAKVQAWEQVPGIGKAMAGRIVKAIRARR